MLIRHNYLPVCNKLTLIGYVILQITRIVLAQALCKRVVSLAHKGHQRVVKTKKRLRMKSGGLEWIATQKRKMCGVLRMPAGY